MPNQAPTFKLLANTPNNYAELEKVSRNRFEILRLYEGNFIFWYKDSEGDRIEITDDEDYKTVLEFARRDNK
jgi:hypothetical protein